MTRIGVILAQLERLNPLDPGGAVGKQGGMLLRDIVLIVGACLVLAVVLVIWAGHYVRSSKHHRHRHHSDPAPLARSEHETRRRHHRRHRRRRHGQSSESRGRNPTLAEAGGLPPLRDQSSSSPSS
jgi:hypothetical protein